MTLKYGAPALPALRPPPLTPILRALVLFPLVRVFCARRRVIGRERVPHGQVIFVANHAGHADTPLIIRALPRPHRDRLAPAAAADYFFANRFFGALTTAIVGAFPFPRRGREGLDRAYALMRAGRSVLLFPEGTRTTDGRIGAFKSGVAHLAARDGATIVPVGLAGTRDVLGKGRRLPRRRPVAVVFGEPMQVEAGADPRKTTDRAEAAVTRAAAEAEAVCEPRRTLHACVRVFAQSWAALALAFVWGAAEAIAWPIVPDIAVATLVLAAPRRVLHIAAAAIAGSLCGGLVAYGLGALGAAGMLDHAPLVTARMQASAVQRMNQSGAAGILTQPWSGIPYKVFALQADDAGTGVGAFAWFSLLARGARILQVAAVFAAAGLVLRRWIDHLYAPGMAVTLIVFAYGLSRVVTAWS